MRSEDVACAVHRSLVKMPRTEVERALGNDLGGRWCDSDLGDVIVAKHNKRAGERIVSQAVGRQLIGEQSPGHKRVGAHVQKTKGAGPRGGAGGVKRVA